MLLIVKFNTQNRLPLKTHSFNSLDYSSTYLCSYVITAPLFRWYPLPQRGSPRVLAEFCHSIARSHQTSARREHATSSFPIFWQPLCHFRSTRRSSGCRGEVLELYSGSTQFGWRLGYRVSKLRYFLFSQCSGECRKRTCKWALASSLHPYLVISHHLHIVSEIMSHLVEMTSLNDLKSISFSAAWSS